MRPAKTLAAFSDTALLPRQAMAKLPALPSLPFFALTGALPRFGTFCPRATAAICPSRTYIHVPARGPASSRDKLSAKATASVSRRKASVAPPVMRKSTYLREMSVLLLAASTPTTEKDMFSAKAFVYMAADVSLAIYATVVVSSFSCL